MHLKPSKLEKQTRPASSNLFRSTNTSLIDPGDTGNEMKVFTYEYKVPGGR